MHTHTHALVLALSRARPDCAYMFHTLILLVAERMGPASPDQGSWDQKDRFMRTMVRKHKKKER